MARTKVIMPQMGESITNGTITKWNKKQGDMVAVDEILLEISTDKVEAEIPSPVSGRVFKLMFPEGATVDVGLLIAEIEDDLSIPVTGGEEKTAAPAKSAEAPKKEAPRVAETVQAQSTEKRFYTPLVKSMAKQNGVSVEELKTIKGSGLSGRVNRDDLVKYLESSKNAPAPSRPAAAPQMQAAPAPTPVMESSDRIEVIPVDSMRKTIAKNMIESKRTSPHVNSIGEVDMSHLVKFREAFKDEFFKQEGFKLTYSPFIIQALIMALKEFPKVNASFDGENIYLKKDINIGVAVNIVGKGLVVPVIKNAGTLNMLGLCRALDTYAKKARNRKLTMEELQGGTFTFTNVGSFGTLMATPIILQPQLGIYASGLIQKRAVVIEGDAIAIRSMMYGTHTYDHRLVDGEMGGNFLEAVHNFLKNMKPETMF